MLKIALPTGRMGEKAFELFKKINYIPQNIDKNNRKLVLEVKESNLIFYFVKPTDVAIYVENGAADIGVVGKDILLEQNSDVYELFDLKIGKCFVAIAAPKTFKDNNDKTLNVATKYANITKNYFESIGRNIRIIKLNGSIEIAPEVKLSDVIVDIVETGNTLRENNLEVIKKITDISSRLIANKSTYQFHINAIQELISNLEKVVD